ncbi:Cytokinin dehydrogenase 3 [Sesamum angolense]|uniref:Cytokinin dehydrogenase 3 n=1 Tax=Sesamum angolense TaxID=2727404 RepID=A0AAE1WP30_9LAMI|nr:Cytokinin dehydrogenase 3 [Sesamum angolense]
MWIDVLRAGLEHGLAPVSWTDYLYLSVGGTLSNAGSVDSHSYMALKSAMFLNWMLLLVYANLVLEYVCHRLQKRLRQRGLGHLLPTHELGAFFAVLGGLGQFGIITRARIVLEKAPSRAKWVRLLYSDFSIFTRDQEHLISSTVDNPSPDYVEGSLITHQSPPNNWRSSFYTPSHRSKIASLLKSKKGLLYSIELVKYYDDQTADAIDQELEVLLKDLNFIPGFVFKKDVALIDFLGRVGRSAAAADENNHSEAHPWLNLFVPKSRILDFNAGVFVDIIGRHNNTSGPILFYPLNRKKWDDRMSAVTPEEDVFYTLGLLHSSPPNSYQIYDEFNSQILGFCKRAGIKVKQYLPHYKSQGDWIQHFGPKWPTFRQRKATFDPKFILSPGQGIFNSA